MADKKTPSFPTLTDIKALLEKSVPAPLEEVAETPPGATLLGTAPEEILRIVAAQEVVIQEMTDIQRQYMELSEAHESRRKTVLSLRGSAFGKAMGELRTSERALTALSNRILRLGARINSLNALLVDAALTHFPDTDLSSCVCVEIHVDAGNRVWAVDIEIEDESDGAEPPETEPAEARPDARPSAVRRGEIPKKTPDGQTVH